MGFSSLSFFGWFAFFALASLAWLYAAAWLITRAIVRAYGK